MCEVKRIGDFPEEQCYRIGNTLELSRNEQKKDTEKESQHNEVFGLTHVFARAPGMRKKSHLCNECNRDSGEENSIVDRAGVFAIEQNPRKEQGEVIKQRDLHENLFYPVGSVDRKCCGRQRNADCVSDCMNTPKLTEEEKASHKHIENHLYDHCPVGAFQIGHPQVILKHGEVTQQRNERAFDGVFLCEVEMDADDGKRKQDTHPIGRVEARKAIDNECAQTIGLLKTHEDDKATYDEK